MQTKDRAAPADDEQLGVNTVRLVGRVSADPAHRELPSGDQLVQLRVVVPRPARPPRGAQAGGAQGGRAATAKATADEVSPARTQVDTIDVACWTAVTRRSASRLRPGQVVEVHGALRRRFFKAGAVTQSRYEVEAALVRRVPALG
jgi:single-strand DNA-binding protein